MENKLSINLKDYVKKFLSVNATIEGPLEASNGKQYMKALFEMNIADDDGYCGQSRAYTKCFFEDTHSLLFRKAQTALEEDKPLKIIAAKVIIPTAKEYYILDTDGKRMTKAAGGFRKGSSITLFLIADENPMTAFNAACQAITNNKAWVEPELPEEEIEAEVLKDTGKGKKK